MLDICSLIFIFSIYSIKVYELMCYNLMVENDITAQAFSYRFEFCREKFQLRSDVKTYCLPENFMGKAVIDAPWIMMHILKTH